MKSHPTIKYSVYQLNNYPTGVQAVGIVSTLFWACYTDIFGKRWITGYFNALTGIITSAIILAPSTSTAGIFGAYYWAAAIYCCQATFFAWANDSLRGQPHTIRAVIIASMNFGGNTFQAFWPLIFYRADMAPMFTVGASISILTTKTNMHQRGMWAMIGVCISLSIWVTVMVIHEKRHPRTLQGVLVEGVPDNISATHESGEGSLYQQTVTVNKSANE